jgi:mRNA interferase YafQ
MLKANYTTRFVKDYKLALKRGIPAAEIDDVMKAIAKQQPLARKYKNHPLKGNYKGRMDCHIRPDCVLIYKLDPGAVTFERLGGHSDLFKK